ncbi:acetyl-CoA synthetase-like protein [Anaeromyces robustus]|uniref:Acetyl-CoA synthetase-like protein n=1 Tax=Anaeromyces robustus TaxID=1754192 RepID=A0A1Y1VSM5_9FUNG|nr:acetyl-CoA synthetase-like protein [Anaeromyces robustus]|eukprot:ORX64277.1 acetyl-CoA synthetase-like protein [Anaeromyces robustus]
MNDITKERILNDFNNNNNYYYSNKFYHIEFNKIVKKNSDKIGIIFENNNYTYRQIDEKSNSLAHFLRNNGVKRNDIVPLIFEKSVNSIIASLAIIKAGAAFIFIDPENPKSLIQYIIKEVKAKIILKCLSSSTNIENEKFSEFDSVTVYDIKNHNFNENIEGIDNINESNDICCSFLTSGTTGRPKPVLISHDNMINFLLYSLTYNGKESIYGNYNYVLGFAKETFILSLIDIFYTLINGKTLILCNKEQYNNPELLGDIINKYKVDFIFTTYTRIQNYLYNENFRNSLNNIKIITFCGEKLSIEFLQNLIKYTKAEIYIDYGCTESTGTATVGRINREDIINGKSLTIGKPGCNVNIYILNAELEPVDIGEEGEIYISGCCLSKGYLNQEKLQNEYFIDCPFLFSSKSEENDNGNRHKYQNKMYRTGDIGRWTKEGEIIYIGRTDFQVKIRGQRIELEEIEKCVKKIEGIDNSIVLVKNRNEKDKDNNEEENKCLVCYYILNDKNGITDDNIIISKKEIRNKLKEILPTYMIPNFFIQIDEIPIDHNGKLDRFALPEPNFEDISEEFIPVSTDTEKIISKIFSREFNKKEEYIGKEDDFYDLGGNSLIATRISAEIEKLLHIKISVLDVMKYSTINSISKFIDEMKTKTIAVKNNLIIKRYNQKEYPFILPDWEKLTLNMLNSIRNNLYQFYKLKDGINIEKLIEAIQKVFKRHENLKSVLYEKNINGENYIYYRVNEDAQLKIEYYTIENFYTFIRKFDITKDLLIRVGLIDDKVLLLDMEHSVSDGFSINVFIRELTEIYNGIELEPLPIQYGDYAIHFSHLKYIENENTKKYFEDIFSKPVEIIKFPKKIVTKDKDMDKKPVIVMKISCYDTDNEVYNYINKISKKYNLSRSVIFLTIYGVVLSHYTGQKRIFTSYVDFGRYNYYTKNLIGFVFKFLPMVVDVDYCKDHQENKENKDLNQSYTLMDLIKSYNEVVLNLTSGEIPYLALSKLNLPVTNSVFKFDPYDMLNGNNFDEETEKNHQQNNIVKKIDYKEIYKIYNRNDLLSSYKVEKRLEQNYDITHEIFERKNYYTIEHCYNPDVINEDLINNIIQSTIFILEHKECFEKSIDEIFEMINENSNSNDDTLKCESETEEKNENIQGNMEEEIINLNDSKKL